MIPIIAEMIAKLSYKIPPMAIKAMLYKSTRVEVPKILYLSTCVLPRHIKNVFATRAIMISNETGPCHERAPMKPIKIIKIPVKR